MHALSKQTCVCVLCRISKLGSGSDFEAYFIRLGIASGRARYTKNRVSLFVCDAVLDLHLCIVNLVYNHFPPCFSRKLSTTAVTPCTTACMRPTRSWSDSTTPASAGWRPWPVFGEDWSSVWPILRSYLWTVWNTPCRSPNTPTAFTSWHWSILLPWRSTASHSVLILSSHLYF